MFRSRLFSVVVAASLAAANGCACFDHHPLFHGRNDCCPQSCPQPCGSPCPAPCGPCTTVGMGSMEGPMLQSPVGQPVAYGQLPATNPQRYSPVGQSMPMPYQPQ